LLNSFLVLNMHQNYLPLAVKLPTINQLSNITVSFIGEGNRSNRRKPLNCRNVSGDRHWLHRKFEIQLLRCKTNFLRVKNKRRIQCSQNRLRSPMPEGDEPLF
jgi:hypothetical protein